MPALPPLLHSTLLPSLGAFINLMNMAQAQTQPLFPPSRAPRKLAVSGRAPGRPVRVPGAHPAHRDLRVNAPFLLPARAGAGGIRTRPPKVTTPPTGPAAGTRNNAGGLARPRRSQQAARMETRTSTWSSMKWVRNRQRTTVCLTWNLSKPGWRRGRAWFPAIPHTQQAPHRGACSARSLPRRHSLGHS